MEKLSFKLEIFEGPLDLLLHLIDKNKVNIYDIPISEITEQYLDYLNQLSSMDLDVSSEFLVMAAHLLYIKSKMLLPKYTEPEEDEEDPRQKLIERLLEYKKYKEASVFLEEREHRHKNIFFKDADEIEIPSSSCNLVNLSIDDLLKAFKAVLKKNTEVRTEDKSAFNNIVGTEKVSIKRKIKEILKLLKQKKELKFLDIFNNTHLRAEIVARFLAVLELVKLDVIIIENKDEQLYIYRSKKNGEANEY
ncbi:segregation/condensation protein A [Petroclostridium sp. X23]|uniref:segregation and condensation protein A n=1 Tax=Petroclostridium sp. X23 TaxID=3045146 RepID=UPI0024AD73EF|nr:segregation/condensation protein A [Petroclostridium sp. X23]WHH59441.1 segregation/condensation protein A [Petroclostridium sp. X23]